jgi:hypothetical protein
VKHSAVRAVEPKLDASAEELDILPPLPESPAAGDASWHNSPANQASSDETQAWACEAQTHSARQTLGTIVTAPISRATANASRDISAGTPHRAMNDRRASANVAFFRLRDVLVWCRFINTQKGGSPESCSSI